MNVMNRETKLWIQPARGAADVHPPLGMSLPSAYADGTILLSLVLAAPQQVFSFLN